MSGPFRDSLKESFFLKKSFSFSFGLFGEIMKRSFMLASALAASSIFAASANADHSYASPDPMFTITAPVPGVISFTGTGSATFTNTQGETNAVTVGSNSSFGVTVSGSNTSDYTSAAVAVLDLADTTSLSHATGTASQAFNEKYTGNVAGTKLDDAVSTITSKLVTSTSGGMTEALVSALTRSFENQAAAKAYDVVGNDASSVGTSGVDYQGDIDSYDRAWEAVYSEEYAKAYSTASAASPSNNSHDLAITGLGTISNINSLASSTFDASTQRVDGSTTQEGGTGNAAANMTTANTTFANTSATASASAFAQAFNGGNAANEGDLIVTDVSEPADGMYVVHAERQTTTYVDFYTDDTGAVASESTY